MSEQGRYRVLRKIADGGMAEIFLGTQRGAVGFERLVVLKRVRPDFEADHQFRDALIDEAHIAMSLHHSNIAQVLDLGVARGHTFLVLEFVDGWDLDRLLKRAEKAHLPLPCELALHVVVEMCRALGYAHSRTRDGKSLGIVHRDVTPHNILVSEQGEVKLTDFGIATARTKRGAGEDGSVRGKMGFMSPEQASGAVLDARSDLYTLGTSLYVMATGKRPFVAEGDGPMLRLSRKGEFAAPETVNPSLAPEVARLIKRAMQRDPNERYRSAEEMLLDVEKVQRSALRPAGQTELKRWLSELAVLDHAVPIGRAPPVTGRAPGTPDVPDPSSSDLVLEVVEPSVRRRAEALPPPAATPAAPPPPLPATTEPHFSPPRPSSASHRAAPRDGEPSAEPNFSPPRPSSASHRAEPKDGEPDAEPNFSPPRASSASHRTGGGGRASPLPEKPPRGLPGTGSSVAGQFVIVGVALCLVAAIGFVTNRTGGKSSETHGAAAVDGGRRGAPDSGPGAGTATAATSPGAAGATPTRGAETGGGASVISAADAGSASATPAGGADTASGSGSSGAEPSDGGSAGSVRLYLARREAPPAEGDDAVYVQLTSVPSGAAVYADGNAYGLTPSGFHCRALLSYDFEFIKDGYPTFKARVYVPRRNGQVIEATLAK